MVSQKTFETKKLSECSFKISYSTRDERDTARSTCLHGCRSLLSIGGIICNFALFSTLGGINLDHDFVQVGKLSEHQKKNIFTKNGTLFPEFKWTPTLKCTPKSNYWGGDADVDHTQTIGGYIPPGFRHPCLLV